MALLLLAALVVLLGLCFRELTVVDEAQLSFQFGTIPLLGKRSSLSNIAQVKTGKSRLIDGWGLHFVPVRGWTYNLWGFECVEFKLHGKRFRVGTDDRDGLTEALAEKVSGAYHSEIRPSLVTRSEKLERGRGNEMWNHGERE